MRNLLLILLLIFIYSCTSKTKFPGFDESAWQADRRGCLGKRISLVKSITDNKNSWKGMDDDVLLDLLGKPEKSFYYERNAKAFAYFLEPGSQCNDSLFKKEGKKLTIEINATGFVNLIRIEN